MPRRRTGGRCGLPRLSILMPTYNGARFLVEQVESIFAQTDGDFELLAIDDGSSDETPAMLRDLAARDGRMRAGGRSAAHLCAAGRRLPVAMVRLMAPPERPDARAAPTHRRRAIAARRI